MARKYKQILVEYLQRFPCVVIIGARQTGKSTLIEMLDDSRAIFDLERKADYDQIAKDPDLFFKLHNQPIAIDEARQLPELFPALRVAIDQNRQQSGQYLLSGSSSPELLTQISESLAGRAAIIERAPLSLSEIVTANSTNKFPLIFTGCFLKTIVSHNYLSQTNQQKARSLRSKRSTNIGCRVDTQSHGQKALKDSLNYGKSNT